MTEQEAEALTLRVGRIWLSDSALRCRYLIINALWVIEGQVSEDAFLRLASHQRRQEDLWTLLRVDGNSDHSPILFCRGSSITASLVEDFPVDFAVRWIPIFRRNCWLSGCPIEASAHEKAEWIQSFSREELEAWNLKM